MEAPTQDFSDKKASLCQPPIFTIISFLWWIYIVYVAAPKLVEPPLNILNPNDIHMGPSFAGFGIVVVFLWSSLAGLITSIIGLCCRENPRYLSWTAFYLYVASLIGACEYCHAK